MAPKGLRVGSERSRKHQAGDVLDANAMRACSDSGSPPIVGVSKTTMLKGRAFFSFPASLTEEWHEGENLRRSRRGYLHAQDVRFRDGIYI
jgi:hypothetical protein